MRRHINENLLPLLVMAVFSLATLFSARQLMHHTSQLHDRYYSNRTAAQDLGRAFNDFEATFLSYLTTDTRQTEESLLNGVHHLKKTYDRFYTTIRVNEVDSQFMVHADGLKGELDVLDKFFSPESFHSKHHMHEAAIAALYQVHTTLSDLGYDLILDHNSAFNGEEMNQHRYTLYGAVFMMALSGIILIILLVSKIDRLEEAGEDKEATVKTLEERLAAIELAGDGIGIAESNGRLSFVNRAFVETYGYPSWEDLIGQKWIDFCCDDIRPVIEQEVFASLGTGGSWNGIGTGLRKDKTFFKKSISIAALPRERWIFVVHDVTDSIKVEELSKQRLAAMEVAGDGIGIADADGNLTYMNHALKNLHELDAYDAQDVLGKPWKNIYGYVGRNHIVRHVMPALKEIGYWKGESPIKTKTGHIIHAELTLTKLPDGGMIGTARDVTDRVEAEHQKAELEKQFYQAQKMEAVGRLAGGIAHDFNNILAAMMGYAEFLIDDLPDDSKEKKYAQSIYEGGTQARDVIDRLLMYSKTQEHSMEPLDLWKKVEGVVTMLRSSIPSTIDIQFDAEQEVLPINGNKTLISQAVLNLCVNARDAIAGEHGIINIRIDRQPYAGLREDYYMLGDLVMGREYYEVHLGDTGCGMSKEVLERIFDPFFTTKPVDQGTGLGLSSVHGIMASHDGAVAVTSKLGQGTEFILFFPVAARAVDVKEHSISRPGPGITAESGTKIMVVDDQNDVRAMVSEMLERLGFTTELHERASTALESLTKNSEAFSMVITDQTMPGMTGSEMAKIIDQCYSDMPVILMSGYSKENLTELTAEIDAIITVLHKPLMQAELEQAVSLAMSVREAEA